MANDDLKPKSEHKSRKLEDTTKNKIKTHKRRHSSNSSRSLSPVHKKKHSKKSKHKKRSRSSSSNSSSSTDSDKERERKKRKKAKKKAKKLIKELKKIQKKKEKETKNNIESKEKTDKSCSDVPLELMDRAKAMVPMTKEEWEKKQSVVRRVYDEETGRHRLIKGDGEVVEEIVSRERHKAINKLATEGDGNFFQNKLNINFRK